MKNKRKKKWYRKSKYEILVGIFLILLFSIPILKPLFSNQYFTIHDNAQVVRVLQMGKALFAGQFPVRWVGGLGYGYGYPIFNFYGPLPYYMGSMFMLFSISALTATKLMFGIGVLLSGITMFFLGRSIWGFWGGIISATLYQYAPYHAVNIYIRGSVGEYWAMAFLPLVVLGFQGVIFSKRYKLWYVLIGGFGYAGIILSHNITAMLTTGIIGVLGILILIRTFATCKRQEYIYVLGEIALLILIGLGLSAFFWIPAIAEMRYTQVYKIVGGSADVNNHFLFLDQLWDSIWGYAGSAPGRADGISFKIGKLHIILATLGLVMGLVRYRRRKTEIDKKIIFILIATTFVLFLSIFMTTEYSSFIWNSLPFLQFVQFPWRFLVFIILTISMLGGGISLVRYELKINEWITVFGTIIIVIMIVFVNSKYFKPQGYYSLSKSIYESQQYITWKASKISDEYLPLGFPSPQTENDIIEEKFSTSENATAIVRKNLAHKQSATIISTGVSEVIIHTAYFPGWVVTIDGVYVDSNVINGFIAVNVPDGIHEVTATFINTRIRIIANTISVFTLIAVLGIIMILTVGTEKQL